MTEAPPVGSGPQDAAAAPPDFSTLADAALWYAQNRFPVFPCKPRDKKPRTRHSFKDASKDPKQIRKWWTRWPDANIGLPCGAPSGVIVMDIDPRNGGEESLDLLVYRYGRWPETAEAITGGGGRHVFFKCAGALRRGRLAEGIDLKADGSYVVVAPSIHPSGTAYSWDGTAGAKALLNLCEIPAWLLKLASDGKASEAAPVSEKIPTGQRNSTLTSLGGTMRRRGMSREAIEAALLSENHLRCNPPLPESEVRAIATSVGRYPPRAQAQAPESGAEPSGGGGPRGKPSLEEVLAAARAGRLVVPLQPLRQGLDVKPTTDERQIRDWERQWPASDWGEEERVSGGLRPLGTPRGLHDHHEEPTGVPAEARQGTGPHRTAEPPGDSGSSMAEGAASAHREIGEVFDPRPAVCGFYAADVVDRQRRIPDGCKRLYQRLISFFGDAGCFPSQETLARELGKCEREVWEDLQRLQRVGLLRIIRRGHWRGEHRSNAYEFPRHPAFQGEPQQAAVHSSELSRRVSRNSSEVSRKKRQSEPQQAAKESYSPHHHQGHAPSPTPSPQSPEAEFARRMKECHGDRLDVPDLLQRIHEILDPWEIGLGEWLKLDAEKTTNPAGLKNPVGHYLTLAKSLAAKARGRLSNIDRRLSRDIEELGRHPEDAQRCPKCTAGRVDGGYCTCRMGKDLERAERGLARECAQGEVGR